jgi:hypothetical protein
VREKLGPNELAISTDFSSVCKFENKYTETCAHPNTGTALIAIVQHSPEFQDVDVLETESSVTTKIIGDTVEQVQTNTSKRKKRKVSKKVLKTDVFRAYSDRKGDYVYHHTMMQDIEHRYKHGYLKVSPP